MPSASAKVEKSAPMEATDPLKQFFNMLEKKVRNLEKRKIKLDNYRSDVANGKELLDDQKAAVSKYDNVICLLENNKELSKSMHSMLLESTRQQKKQAKREQIERQQYEIQRLQEAFSCRHILSCFQNEDVRSDFLNGENGAVQLTSEQLSQLDQLFKLISPGLPNEQADLMNHFHVLAENHIFLVEGKNKEIAGTTYKVLKELLHSIKESGYFSKPSEPLDLGTSSDEMPEEEVLIESPAVEEEVQSPCSEQLEITDDDKEISNTGPVQEAAIADVTPSAPNAPLPEVLAAQSSFNFLQESQIDLGAPHMDPAVVAVHQMAPPPAVNFAMNPYPAPIDKALQPLVNGTEPHEVAGSSPVPVMSAARAVATAPVLTSVQHGGQLDFDPSHPIPTQTFTNQSFAVMQNMIVPQAYVPVTMHHGPIPPHMGPIAVVPGPAVTSAPQGSIVPMPVPVPIQDGGGPSLDAKSEFSEAQQNGDSSNASETDPNSNDAPGDRGKDHNGFPQYRGGYRGRGRGRGNGYFRGRSNYHNGGRGGYQNNYYQDRNGYNGNFRRGNNRGGPRGGNGGNGGNNRGRGNYRTQASEQHPQPQQQPQQQTQQ